MIREKSCGAIIIRHNIKTQEEEYLIIQQLDGHYGFPKGHMENGETEMQTAHREILEETGYKVKILPNFRVTDKYSPYHNAIKTVVYFLAKVSGGLGEVQKSELIQMKWLDYETALNTLTYQSDKHHLNIAQKYVKDMY